jgi:uncharacterized protein YwqG
MTINEIKTRLFKKAVKFTAVGNKLSNLYEGSWIGGVFLYKQEEEIPKDKNGDLMLPLFQASIKDLPFVPNILRDTSFITVFVSKDIPSSINMLSNKDNWEIREYKASDRLVLKDLKNLQSHIKPFNLQANIIAQDFPVWDAIEVDILQDIVNEIDKHKGGYYDIFEVNYCHKIGGYPTFCQSAIKAEEGFEFVLQINSDEKVGLNIIDNGTIFLFKNPKTKEWKYYCDFY